MRGASESGSDSEYSAEDEDETSASSEEYSSSSVSGSEGSLEERRESHGRASVSAKALRSIVTNKAVIQDGERLDLPIPSKFPKKPMVELQSCSNVWYQGSVIKESANEVKIAYSVPNVQGKPKPRIEWFRKASGRIWRGSLSKHAWKHLGKGAWEPRKAPKLGGRSKRGARATRRPKQRIARQKSGTSDDGEADTSDELDARPSVQQPGPQPARKQAVQRQQQSADDDDARPSPRGARPVQPPNDGRLDGGGGGGRSKARPLTPTGAAMRAMHQPAAAAAPVPPAVKRVAAEDEQASEHSPNVAESPGGILCDQFSARCSPSDEEAAGQEQHAGGAAGQEPGYDPLARWFEVHYAQLQAAGMLGLLPGGMYECGQLPDGFRLDPSSQAIAVCEPPAAMAGATGIPALYVNGSGVGASPPPPPSHHGDQAAAGQTSLIPQQQPPPRRHSYDGSKPSVFHTRQLAKHNSGGSSSAGRDDAAVAALAAVSGGQKRPQAAMQHQGGGGVAEDEAAAGGVSGGAAKKQKRAVILSDSESDGAEDGVPPPPPAAAAAATAAKAVRPAQPPASAPQAQQQQHVAVLREPRAEPPAAVLSPQQGLRLQVPAAGRASGGGAVLGPNGQQEGPPRSSVGGAATATANAAAGSRSAPSSAGGAAAESGASSQQGAAVRGSSAGPPPLERTLSSGGAAAMRAPTSATATGSTSPRPLPPKVPALQLGKPGPATGGGGAVPPPHSQGREQQQGAAAAAPPATAVVPSAGALTGQGPYIPKREAAAALHSSKAPPPPRLTMTDDNDL